MSTIPRYLRDHLAADLEKKMVFLGGPRQVGKTTCAQDLLPHFRDEHPAYLNWDVASDRKTIRDGTWSRTEPLIILDEIHKFARWRQMIKGHYDKLKRTHQFLVTGSARLDYYRKSGDALLGRYYSYRLHPLSLPELQYEDLDGLVTFGGFPEPYLQQSPVELQRWHRQRTERIIYADVRELERVKEISLIQLLAEMLPERVGSPLSRKNLAQDLEIDFKTAERWITILENVYYCFRIAPFGAPRVRAVKKENKLYLWDWSEIDDAGARWENLVASHLLKYCHYREDTEGVKMELRFLRDTDGREVDFVVLEKKKPLFAVECKSGERKPSSHLRYFQQRTPIPMFYQVHRGTQQYAVTDTIHVLPFADFCKEVGLV
jgi:uncharacterized protein